MKHTWKKAAAFVLATALVAGVAPVNVGTGGLFSSSNISLTAYADNTVSLLTTLTFGGSSTYSETTSGVVSVTATNVSDYNAKYGWLWYEGGSLSVTAEEGYTITKCVFIQNSKSPLEDDKSPFSIVSMEPYTVDTSTGTKTSWMMDGVTSIEVYGYATPAVTGVSLDKTTAQTVTVGDKVAFTATVSPDGATDKTVKWSASNANVKLYSDEACTTEVGTDATDVLTVYAKGITAGNATVTATSNADATKTASCDVTVDPAFSNASVTLADDLAFNFYVDGIADDTAAAEYTVNFTGACVDESSALTYNATEGKYYATTHVYAKDIDKDITATLCKGSDTIDTVEDYSITQYLTVAAGESPNAETDAMIEATKNFGYASAEYFYGDEYGVTATFEDYDPDVSAYATTFSSDDAKLSLVLDSKTAARLYVKGDTTGTDSTINATKAEYPTYHEITELLPQNLADEQTITVGGTDYKFSALSWCNRVLTNGSASQKNINMAKAIMAYYQAAKNYTAAENPVPAATMTTAPTAKTGVKAGTNKAIVNAGTAEGGTMMYAVTTDNTQPASTDGFSATVPTAEGLTEACTRYVWYYVEGDASHTDSEISATGIEVTIAAAPTLAD